VNQKIADSGIASVSHANGDLVLAHQEFFGRFRSQKYSFAAVFGRDSAKPFEELWRIRLEINLSVDQLLRNKEMARGNADDRAFWREQYDIAFRSAKIENDVLSKSISEQVSAIENTCGLAIEASPIK
jgi:hypothetical protein